MRCSKEERQGLCVQFPAAKHSRLQQLVWTVACMYPAGNCGAGCAAEAVQVSG